MGIGTSLFLIALGAILDFAVVVHNPRGVNIHSVGIILMIVGALGVVLSLMFWSTWGGFGRRDVGAGTRRRVIEEDTF